MLAAVVNTQTRQISLLYYDLQSYEQDIIKELLGFEAPLAPGTEGKKHTPQAQHIRG